MSIAGRVAGAPISWGVCEVPGWGIQLPPSVVLKEMAEMGLAATESGPEGFLPQDPNEAALLLSTYGLKSVGSFVPVVLFDSAHDPAPEVEEALTRIVATGAGTLVLAAASGVDGYDSRPVLDERQWSTLLNNLDRLDALARQRGITASLHPHVGTMVETPEEVERVLSGSGIGLTLDTGHLLIGGTDPLALARRAATRIRHAHLKDVHAPLAERVRAGEISYTDGVRAGMYCRLGEGDVDVAGIVTTLEDAGYTGWYVMEQDTIVKDEPTAGRAPVDEVRASYEYLMEVTK